MIAHLKMCQFFAIGLFERGVRCLSLNLSMWNDENHSDFHHSCIHQWNILEYVQCTLYKPLIVVVFVSALKHFESFEMHLVQLCYVP